MPKALQIIDDEPLVYIRDGEVFASSARVALMFGKNHKNVVSRIKQVIAKSKAMGIELIFKLIAYVDSRGRTQTAYEMDREAFASVTLGFTGEAALEFRLRYVGEFHCMERELAHLKASTSVAVSAPTGSSMQIDMRNPIHYAAALRQVLEIAEEAEARAVEERRQKERAIAYIDETAPLVELAEDVVASDELITLSQAARVIGCGHQRFFDFVQGKYLFRENGALVPYAPAQRDGLFRVKYANVNGRQRPQTHVTGMGVAAIRAAMKASRRDLLSHLDRLPLGVTRTTPTALGRPSS